MKKFKKETIYLQPLRVALLACACGFILGGQALAKPPEIPERLLQASEQAAKAQMQISSMMAREIGHKIAENIKSQDTRNLPDYMRQTVRLDFYGPMDEVLNRLANDLGWHVASFGEPVMGGMKPHVHLQDAKPLHQHIAELGSQIPWPLMVDLRNERLVVDYRSGTGTDDQVRLTREHLDNNRKAIASGHSVKPRTLPKQYTQNTQTQSGKSNWVPTPVDPTALMYNADYSGWGVELGAYSKASDARGMLTWLQERSIDASARIDNGLHRIRVLAVNQSVASTLQQYLLSQGVEGEVSYASPEEVQKQLTADQRATVAQQSIASTATQQVAEENEGWRSKLTAPRTAMANPSATQSNPNGAQAIRTATRAPAMPKLESLPKGYGVQTISYTEKSRALQVAQDLRSKQYPAFVFKLGKHYGVRVGMLSRREQAKNLKVAIRKMGFSDAYVVKASKEV